MLEIHYSLTQFSLGSILVAKSSKGICFISMSDDANELLQALHNKFPHATFTAAILHMKQMTASIIEFIEKPLSTLDFPLDMHGTVFQQKVWEALKKIPVGHTATYTDIAQQIGSPKSIRAVAQACAANALAVVIPCHRVIKKDGTLSGYRWGIDRKKILLARESTL